MSSRRVVFQVEQPILQQVGASESWTLKEPWSCRIPGGHVQIPAGQVTDLASAPELLHWLVDQDDLGAGAFLHDILYRYGGRLPEGWVTPARTFTRREADDLLYLVAVLSGCDPWRARVAWLGVRVGGVFAWKG